MYKIISVGGSIIIPKIGFDIPFLKKFKKLILDEIKKGEKFILVVGGGSTARSYQSALSKVTKPTHTDLDWMGIGGTVINAQFVRLMFGDIAHEDIVIKPIKKVSAKKSLIIAAGYQPGWSTDMDSVLLAKTYGAHEVINLSNIAYVYDKDPKKFKNAKKLERIDWKTFRHDIVGTTWTPGKNVPFDPVASQEAEKLKLTVKILKGTDLGEVKKAIEGKKFRGTVVV